MTGTLSDGSGNYNHDDEETEHMSDDEQNTTDDRDDGDEDRGGSCDSHVIVAYESNVGTSRYVVRNEFAVVIEDKRDGEWYYRDEAGRYVDRDTPEDGVLLYFRPHSYGVELSRLVVRGDEVWWEDHTEDGEWDARVNVGDVVSVGSTSGESEVSDD